MAVICRSIGLLFIMAPRTGCSAVGRVLREELGGEWLPEAEILDARGRLVLGRKHGTLKQLLEHGKLAADEAASLLKVTCVRNPFDSIVSLYTKRRNFSDEQLKDPAHWMHRRPKILREVHYCRSHTFDEWIRKQYYRRAILVSLGLRRAGSFDRFTEGVDVVMRFERLQEDFNEVLKRVGVHRQITIPLVNPTRGRDTDYRPYYSPGSRSLVERAFRPDLRRYGYGF